MQSAVQNSLCPSFYCRGYVHTLITPAELSQAEIKRHRLLHTDGQDLLFRLFPLRKNSFRHSTVPRAGRGKGGGGSGSYEGPLVQ